MNSEHTLSVIRQLEVELHQAETRNNETRLNALLHPSFVEIGRSGHQYTKADILLSLNNDAQTEIHSQDFSLHEVAKDYLYLLLYQSAERQQDGSLARFTRRSSLWQTTGASFQLRFHQATATDAYIKCA